jgi:MoxR-like ATPase
MLLGEPGAGKTLLVRRLAEVLSVGLWRTNAARSDATFGGTDRRWHWLRLLIHLAIARHKSASVFVLLDELEKAPPHAGSDAGLLWSCLLGFLEG